MKRRYRIGFACRELNERGILPAQALLAPLEVRCLVVETDTGPACWAVFDLTALTIDECLAIRAAVAAAVGCRRGSVTVHCTHTHSVPSHFHAFPVEALAVQAAAAAREARGRMRPFRVAAATVDVGSRFSLRRRKFIPGLGTFTVWYGYRLENGRADGAARVREQAARMLGPRARRIPELAGPLWFDDPVDPLAQGLAFIGDDGAVLGSLIRFSAHPHTTSHIARLRYHPDFPGFARGAVERRLGGRCIYLTGPCGDLSPKEEMRFRLLPAAQRPAGVGWYFGPCYWHKAAEPGEALRAAQGMGEKLAAAIVARLVGCVRGRPAGPRARATAPAVVCARSVPLTVPIRADYAASPGQARAAQAAATRRLFAWQQAGCASPWELRALADHAHQLGLEVADVGVFPAGAIAARRVVAELGLLRLGDIVLAGLPGEPCVGTSLRLRANTLGEKLWTVSLVNGWFGYLPDSFGRLSGGYEGVRTPLPADGLLAYEAQAGRAIRMLAPDP